MEWGERREMGTPEQDMERRLLTQLGGFGFDYVELGDYPGLLENLRIRLSEHNAAALRAKKGTASLSRSEFRRFLASVDVLTVWEAAGLLRDKVMLRLDNEEDVYLELLSPDAGKNRWQVTHQVTVDPAHRDDVLYRNRYDVTILANGIPVVQIELKRHGIEIGEALNQLNRYRRFSFRGVLSFLQLLVISNGDVTRYMANENLTRDGRPVNIPRSHAFFWTDERNERIARLDAFAEAFLVPGRLCDMLWKHMVVKSATPQVIALRPYQVYEAELSYRRVLDGGSCYNWAATGSGKTLTAFTLAKMLRDTPAIAKAFLLVDRTDLDDQTAAEWNSFEAGSVDQTDSTGTLARQLADDGCRLVITTMQKLHALLRGQRYSKLIAALADARLVFIVDECHRSQCGKMRADMERHFRNASYVGFTGTPLLAEGGIADGRTTADVFEDPKGRPACIHRYMQNNAIADGLVLPYEVEERTTDIRVGDLAGRLKAMGLDPARISDPGYCAKNRIDADSLWHDADRIEKVAADVICGHWQRTHVGQDVYAALLSADSIAMVGRYYDALRAENGKRPEDMRYRISAVFSVSSNPDMDGDVVGDMEEGQKDLMARVLADYNAEFGTKYDLASVDQHKRDAVARLKGEKTPKLDILVVNNMLLTGFDSSRVSTLYLDRFLKGHTLVQAYSRTNRVAGVTKSDGHIVTYRPLKEEQDAALRLYSGGADPNECLSLPYADYAERYAAHSAEVREASPTPDGCAKLRSEDDIRRFVLAFRALASTLAKMMTFAAFDWPSTKGIGEEEYRSYKSWYLMFSREARKRNPAIPVPVDVDYEVRLVQRDRIDVAYILRLLQGEGIADKDEAGRESDIRRAMRLIERSDDDALRERRDVVERFCRDVLPGLPKGADVVAAYRDYEREAMYAELDAYANSCGLAHDTMRRVFSNAEFSGTVPMDDIRAALQAGGTGILALTRKTQDISDFIISKLTRYVGIGDEGE